MYRVQKVIFESDSVTPREVVNQYDFPDLLEATKYFQILENAVLISMNEDPPRILSKRSKGFSKDSIKQYYLNQACDFMNLYHIIYGNLLQQNLVSDLEDRSYDQLIEKILIEARTVDDPAIRQPILNELILKLVKRRN